MFFVSMIVVGAIFAIIDAVWLKLASTFYKKEIGSLLLKKPNLKVAVLFYVLYVAGVTLLVVHPAVLSGDGLISYVAVNSALLGAFAYATYDLTNLATLKGWSAKLVVVDIIWGIVVTSVSASLGYLILANWIF